MEECVRELERAREIERERKQQCAGGGGDAETPLRRLCSSYQRRRTYRVFETRQLR